MLTLSISSGPEECCGAGINSGLAKHNLSSTAIGLIAFACVFGAGLLGGILRAALPEEHLKGETRDAVKLAMALVATMTALVLGLLVASEMNSYDLRRSEVIQLAAKITFLDRVLANYGPETTLTRQLLHRAVELGVSSMWPENKTRHAQLDPSTSGAEMLYDFIQQLSPQNEYQKAIKSQALTIAVEVAQMRWLLLEQAGSSVSTPLLLLIVFWLAIVFLSFGVFAPFNGTVIAALGIAALSVSCALLLISELDRPFEGIIQISSEPMRNSLQHLGQ
jgi:hypothetical protein